jgi:hypothetical protein
MQLHPIKKPGVPLHSAGGLLYKLRLPSRLLLLRHLFRISCHGFLDLG